MKKTKYKKLSDIFAEEDVSTISEWVDLNRLSISNNRQFSLSITPYLTQILNDFSDYRVRNISFVKPSQVGGTEALYSMMLWAIVNDPYNIMMIYPRNEDVKRILSKRIAHVLDSTPSAKARMTGRISNSEMTIPFVGGNVIFAGSNIDAGLESWDCKNIIADEVDLFGLTDKKNDPIEKAEERRKSFINIESKFVMASKPTHSQGNIWRAKREATTQYEYHCPCIHCGEYQKLRMKTDDGKYLLRWEKGATASEARQCAYYVCEFCGATIEERDRFTMVSRGKWIPIIGGDDRTKVSYAINSLISPFLNFGDVASAFLYSKDDKLKLKNFVNGTLGEPFDEINLNATQEMVYKRIGDNPMGAIPADTLFMTGGVDVQQDCMYYVIRAWQPKGKSETIEFGQVLSFNSLYKTMTREFTDIYGKVQKRVNSVLIDNGYNTNEVNTFCAALNYSLFVPVKGASTFIAKGYRINKMATDAKVSMRMAREHYVSCYTPYFKEMFYEELRSKEPKWLVNSGLTEEYAKQVTSEHKIPRFDNRNYTNYTWEPITPGIDNHYFDCEVYAQCAKHYYKGL